MNHDARPECARRSFAMITGMQIVKALIALIGAGTVVYLINRASRKQVAQREEQS
jgi:hypothetical protein